MQTLRILDLKIHKINVDQLIENIVVGIREGKKLKVFNLNVHAFNVAFKDPNFKNIINNGDLVFCDGFGVKIGAGILGLSIGDRMTPPDWIEGLCSVLAENDYSIYLLGDEPGVAEKCATIILEKHPTLNIKGAYHGFFDKDGRENAEVISIINQAAPDVLLVGFGMPLQEKWISANNENINSSIFISVGAMFRWIARVEKRAPPLLASNGFEWLWRLLTQPGKVWKRYTIEVMVFFFKVLYTATFGKKYNKFQRRELFNGDSNAGRNEQKKAT